MVLSRHLVLACVLAAVSAAAVADTEEVVSYLDSLQSFTASFTQQRFDEDGELLETLTGEAYIERPGRFRWAYGEPYVQLIVSDGETLWIYDEDLEQVTVNAVDDSGQGSPAALLGHESDVAADYAITALPPADDGYAWYRLESKEAASDFSAVALGFADGEVRAMRLTDNLGQLTALSFDGVARNRDVDDALFHFVPPAGVDVVQGAMP